MAEMQSRQSGHGNEATTAAGTYTVGNLACVTATNTVGDCTAAANNPFFIGVNVAKDGTLFIGLSLVPYL